MRIGESPKSNFSQQVYKIVKQIPKGKVMTYGGIAFLIQRSNIKYQKCNSKIKVFSKPNILARAVGNALHENHDPQVPCHRVVDRNGRLAKNFAFGGVDRQRKRLISEGISFKDKIHVDLKLVII